MCQILRKQHCSGWLQHRKHCLARHGLNAMVKHPPAAAACREAKRARHGWHCTCLHCLLANTYCLAMHQLHAAFLSM